MDHSGKTQAAAIKAPVPVAEEAGTGWSKSQTGSAPTQANPFHIGLVYRIEGWRYWLIVWPAALLLRLYYATLRCELDAASRAALSDRGRPLVCVLWHSRSFITPHLLRRFRPRGGTSSLISPSKAAAWEAALFHALGLASVRGSSSRRSIQAVRDMLKVSASGRDLVISPDGPSGPDREFKRGAVATARMAKTPILLMGAECDCAWRPHTWDRHLFPLPFAKLRIKGMIVEPGDYAGQSDEQLCAMLADKLDSINVDSAL